MPEAFVLHFFESFMVHTQERLLAFCSKDASSPDCYAATSVETRALETRPRTVDSVIVMPFILFELFYKSVQLVLPIVVFPALSKPCSPAHSQRFEL